MLSIQVSLLRETLDHIQQEANETQQALESKTIDLIRSQNSLLEKQSENQDLRMRLAEALQSLREEKDMLKLLQDENEKLSAKLLAAHKIDVTFTIPPKKNVELEKAINEKEKALGEAKEKLKAITQKLILMEELFDNMKSSFAIIHAGR